ncbi:MAG: GNAT family N-acetyltransferase [Balneolales bacterium]
MNIRSTECFEIRHGSEEYRQSVALRDEMLRRPLELKFTPDELINEKDSFHLACRMEGEIVACVVFKPLSRTEIHMRQMAVRSGWQGSGLGSRLLDFAEDFVFRKGFREIVLHARETAIGFYKKLGYRIESDRFIEVTIPHFVMRKSLENNRKNILTE